MEDIRYDPGAGVEMEYGGYVEPPSHLSKSSRTPPAGLAAELRTVPDYDYSLFRYSKLALPFLALILLSAAILLGLTFWQGPFGWQRGPNGLQDGMPLEFALAHVPEEGGLSKPMKNLRIFNFVCATTALLIVVFAIRAQPRPTFLRIWFIIAIILLVALWVTAAITFALGIDQVHRSFECEEIHFSSPGISNVYDNRVACDDREQMSIAAITSNITLSTFAILLAFALGFTMISRNWAWGPGKVSVQKSPLRPRISYPPPSPFTHIHETRRLYVWLLIFIFAAVLTIDFIFTIMLHEQKVVAKVVDARNRSILMSGWPQKNNRLRMSVAIITFAFAAFQVMDLLTWKRRWFAYTIGVLFVFCSAACFVVFGIDIDDLNAMDDVVCPEITITYTLYTRSPHFGTITRTQEDGLNCVQFNYIGTAFVEFWLGIVLIVYLLYEFLYRINFTWDTYYFYADSEWLRNHSLFVEQTDREAYDWKRYTMETGRDYYYSPTLGISTRTRPRNYVDPELPLGPML